MRFSTAVVLAFIAATSSTPAFAKRGGSGRGLEHLNNAFGAATGAAELYGHLKGREDFDIYARDEDLVARARGKFHIGNKLEHLNNGLGAAAGAAELYRNIKGREEFDDLFARDDSELIARARGGKIHIGNKLEHLNNAIGAANGAAQLYGNLKGREDLDMYARDDIDLVARARGGKFHIGNKLEHLNNGINAAAGAAELYRTVKGREEFDMYARDDSDLVARARGGGFHIGNKLEHLNNAIGAANGAAQLYGNLKGREDLDMYARDDIDLVARARGGKFHIGNKLEHLNNAIGAANGAAQLYGNLKGREDLDMYARDDIDLVARARGGGFHIGNKLEHLNNGVNAAAGAAELYNRLKGREEFDMYARDDSDLVARARGGGFHIGNKLEHLNNGINAAAGAAGLYNQLKGRDDVYGRDSYQL